MSAKSRLRLYFLCDPDRLGSAPATGRSLPEGEKSMMTPQQFAQALRMTESLGNPRAWGDADEALTSYQVHPAWLWDRIDRFHLEPAVTETWESWIGRYVEAFYDSYWPLMSEVQIAMFFHRGHPVEVADRDWDVPYAARFAKFARIATGQADVA